MGFSYLGAKEGWHLDSENNEFKVPSHFESILQGYSSESEKNPGHPVKIDAGDRFHLIKANCLKESAYSFSPAFIVPLPPVIPLFGVGSGSVNERVIVTVEECGKDSYVINGISASGVIYEPISVDNCSYRFDISCNDVKSGVIILEAKDHEKVEINFNYIKKLIYGWGWLGA